MDTLKLKSTKIMSLVTAKISQNTNAKECNIGIPDLVSILGIASDSLYHEIDDITTDIMEKLPEIKRCAFDVKTGLKLVLSEKSISV